MKRLLITGYYGFNNLGDEAVLQAIIGLLRQAEPDCQICVLSNNPEQTTAAYQVKAVNRWKLGQFWRALKETDLFILGGGSLLQDVTGSRSLSFYLLQLKMARIAGKPTVVFAQGLGPLLQEKSRRKTAKALNECLYLSFRDAQSAELARKIGVNSDKIEVVCDPVLTLNSKDNKVKQKHLLAVALRPWPGLQVQAVAAVLDELAAGGQIIKLLPFHEPQDRQLAEQVASLMRSRPQIMAENLTAAEVIAEISACEALIGMRLHSLIMAAAAGTPFGGISYDPKIDSFCRQTNCPLLCQVSGFNRDCIESIWHFLRNKEKYQSQLIENRIAWQTLSAETAQKIINSVK